MAKPSTRRMVTISRSPEQAERERADDLSRLKQAYVEGEQSGTPREIDRERLLADFRA